MQRGCGSIGQVVQAAGGEQAVNSDLFASILLACFDGLALQHITGQNFAVEDAYGVLTRMINVFLEHS
ncbi:hypothetical protein [Reticulibacter mediterranei]|uniref:hypothetical protein n=1 Tax=Reticulibacter mediterranei TaxID=2778369 RepID=UPI001C6876F1|nr:hypothetical protein [Reticulibacter mediterranei]